MSASGKAFARAFDHAHAMVRDLDGRIRFWSGSMERLYGWRRDDAVGRISHDLLKTEFPKPLSEIEAELLTTGRWEGELRHHTRDGRTIEVASHWALDRDYAGRPACIIEVNNDITALKAVQEELALRQAELRRAKEAAEQTAQLKSRVLAAVGHDLKQPLHIIGMTLSMLERHLTAPNQHRLLARANRSIDKLATALDTLLEVARLESGVVEPRIEAFPIQQILDEIEDQFGTLAVDKGLSFHVADSTARVRSDREMLGTILHNLVGNAIKYTVRGGIVVSCQQRDGFLSTQVRDTGIGIPPEKLELVFEEFQRLEPGGREEGLGLGLAIVRRTAEVLGHRLSVRSSVGEGSVFGIDIPLDAVDVYEPAPPGMPAG